MSSVSGACCDSFNVINGIQNKKQCLLVKKESGKRRVGGNGGEDGEGGSGQG